ncbi:unnamed protein product [Caenorhabditis brenneri]
MAWQVQGACMTYNFDSMPVVSQTDSTNGSIVAFKVDTKSGQCGVNPLDSQNATGSLYITSGLYPKWIYYTISPVGNTLKMSYSVNSSCTGTLYYHQRLDGTGLCYNVLMVRNYGFNYTASVANCINYNTSLASFRNQEDAKFFMNMYPSYRSLLLNATGSESTYVRVDGKRTENCQATPTTSECMSVSGFTFVGPPPESFDYFDWTTDSSAQATPDDNCIVIVWNGNNPINKGCLSYVREEMRSHFAKMMV